MSRKRILFISRNPIVHQLGGSSTVALNLLNLLVSHGAEITHFVTSAYSRSPGLYFRVRLPVPPGVTQVVPGSIRLGDLYLNLFSPRAWLRAFLRTFARFPVLHKLTAALVRISRGSVAAEAWDLSPPTAAELAACRAQVNRLNPDVLIVNYAFWAPLLAAGFAPASPRRIILMHDLLSARIAKFVASGLPLDCPFISEETELDWLDQADCVLAVQKTEAEFIAGRIASQVLVQPIVMPVVASPSEPRPFQCLFVGTNIQPNASGIRWFLDEVWPLVLKGNPAAALHIAGTVCTLLPPGLPNVTLLGVVPSLDQETARAAICIVPLLIGSGIKVKLLEALAAGKACVATPIGVQGLEGWTDGAVEVASQPADFAAAVLRLMSDPEARRRLEAGATHLIRTHFSAGSEPAREFARVVLD